MRTEKKELKFHVAEYKFTLTNTKHFDIDLY